MAVKDVLLLGNPALYDISKEVDQSELDFVKHTIEDLHDTLMDFRNQYGVGRAIAAPQIGVFKRIIYMHIDRPATFINPEIVDPSDEMIELWDDCMCFPDLLVHIKRHHHCTIKYRDLQWQQKTQYLDGDLSELLQHECDHLNGILAVDRAIDSRSFCYRCEREKLTT